MKIKATELPYRPKDLYVQLYCQEKGSFTEETIQTALQSWLSLRPSRKEHFKNTVRIRRQVINTQKLVYTLPYLNAKSNGASSRKTEKHAEDRPNSVVRENMDVEIESLINITTTENANENLNYDSVVQDEFSDANSVLNVNELSNDDKSDTLSQHNIDNENSINADNEPSNRNSNLSNAIQNVTEPMPPVKKGRDLFNILNKDVTKSYSDLSNLNKRAYTNALLVIKKKYISDYKNYLENLSNEQLFEHYNKTFSNC